MANLRLGRGTLTAVAATNIDSHAVPVGQQRVVKALTICNRTTTQQDVTLTFDGTYILDRYPLPGRPGENTVTIPFVDQIMNAGERIQGWAGNPAAVDFYLSGIERAV